jgi:hypothetical protein
MGVADSGDERTQKADELLSLHPLCGNLVQEALQTAVESDLAPSVDIWIGMRALENVREPPRVLD